MKKAHLQVRTWMIAEPNAGPTAAASAATAPQTATAKARCSFLNSPKTRDNEVGVRNAAPKPCSARAAIRNHTPCEIPQRSDPAVNIGTPVRKILFLPNLSA